MINLLLRALKYKILNKNITFPVFVDFPRNIENNARRINYLCYLSATPETKITLGKGTLIAPNVKLFTCDHNPNDYSKAILGNITIGKNVWIGTNSVILPDVVISDNSIVGANSVVTKGSRIKEGELWGGVPARLIKKRRT